MMRRLIKEELYRFDGTPLFPERLAYTASYALSPPEADLYATVTTYVREEMNETAYAERTKDVSGSKIKTAAALWDAMKAIVPDDITFKSKFATATVSKADLAKYYLRILELQSKSDDDETIVNPDHSKVSLEHILLPRNPAEGWAHIPAAQTSALINVLATSHYLPHG